LVGVSLPLPLEIVATDIFQSGNEGAKLHRVREGRWGIKNGAIGSRKLGDLEGLGGMNALVWCGSPQTPRVGAMTPQWPGNRRYIIPQTPEAPLPNTRGLGVLCPIGNGLFQAFIYFGSQLSTDHSGALRKSFSPLLSQALSSFPHYP